jgi:hypothetical protein
MFRRWIFRAGTRVGTLRSPLTMMATPSAPGAALLNSYPTVRQSPFVGSTTTSLLRALFSSYPSHEVVGLPALSPVRPIQGYLVSLMLPIQLKTHVS